MGEKYNWDLTERERQEIKRLKRRLEIGGKRSRALLIAE